ncbi:MAG: 4Fe-4S binding protein [Deltaproteobacteria bacterium]|nr:4Fe-4S binding protein [Deltaproteobacteria bacterium]
MDIHSVKLVYFSPTQTTEKVLKAIAKGISVPDVGSIDMTGPDSRIEAGISDDHTLYIFGAPVYAGRVPALAVKRFAQIRGNGAPAVAVVVYGNRAYDDALLELRDLLGQNGFTPVAGAAFIGEHSFSDSKTPIAKGRPDPEDLEKAAQFGASLADKIKAIDRPDRQGQLQVPGKLPYQPYGAASGIPPVTDNEVCVRCETCVDSCPTGAIRLDDVIVTDAVLCIACCACVKNCPNGARTMEAPRVQKVAQWLHTNFQARKEPELFF